MLKKSALGWPKIAGLGIALVVAGQFSGWNYGLMAGGRAGVGAGVPGGGRAITLSASFS